MKENLHAGHRSRLRERANNSEFNNMDEHQILELLLTYVIPRADTNPIAHRLINTFGSFANVLDAKVEDLIKVNGVGNKTANFISSIKHFFFAYNKSKLSKVTKINNMQSLLVFVGNLLSAKINEQFYAIYLDNNGTVKRYELISSGSVNQAAVSVKKIMEQAISANACSVAVCHNHPGGKALPSAEDDKLTKAIALSLTINGVGFVDHVIIGAENKYYSYRQQGLIEKFTKNALNILLETGDEKTKAVMQPKFEFYD